MLFGPHDEDLLLDLRPGAYGVSCRARELSRAAPRMRAMMRSLRLPPALRRAVDSPRPGARKLPGNGSPVRSRTGQGRFGRPNTTPRRITAVAPGMCEAGHTTLCVFRCVLFVRAARVRDDRATLACKNLVCVTNPDRLTGLDSSFLHLERDAAHMHVAGCSVFEGAAPGVRGAARGDRLAPAPRPRYRQRLAFVPFQQGRPVWVDDPHFNSASTCDTPRCLGRAATTSSSDWPDACSRRRSTAPGHCGSCGWSRASTRTASRCCRRPTTRSSTASPGVDIATVLFDTSPDPMPVAPPEQRMGRRARCPSEAQLLADALLERATVPAEIVRGVRAALRGPRQVADRVGRGARRRWRDGVGGPATGARRARSTSGSARTGASPGCAASWPSSRRSRTRSAERSTTSCSRSSPARSAATCACTDDPTDDLVLKAMVPVSVRADVERGALGNQRRGDVGAAAGRRHRPGPAAAADPPRRWTGSRNPDRPSAPRC